MLEGGITITPVVLSNSFEVFGVGAVLSDPSESGGGPAAADWACSIILLGENGDIVAVTRPVRSVHAHNHACMSA